MGLGKPTDTRPARPATTRPTTAAAGVASRASAATSASARSGATAINSPPEVCASASSVRVISSTPAPRSEEHTSELQSRPHLVCRLLLEKKKKTEMLHSHPDDVFRVIFNRQEKIRLVDVHCNDVKSHAQCGPFVARQAYDAYWQCLRYRC